MHAGESTSVICIFVRWNAFLLKVGQILTPLEELLNRHYDNLLLHQPWQATDLHSTH